MQRFPRLAAMALALSASPTPWNAQPPACDPILVGQIAVKGLNPALLTYPVSSLSIPTLGFATPDMASVIDSVVGNYMNQNGSAGGTVAIDLQQPLDLRQILWLRRRDKRTVCSAGQPPQNRQPDQGPHGYGDSQAGS